MGHLASRISLTLTTVNQQCSNIIHNLSYFSEMRKQFWRVAFLPIAYFHVEWGLVFSNPTAKLLDSPGSTSRMLFANGWFIVFSIAINLGGTVLFAAAKVFHNILLIFLVSLSPFSQCLGSCSISPGARINSIFESMLHQLKTICFGVNAIHYDCQSRHPIKTATFYRWVHGRSLFLQQAY